MALILYVIYKIIFIFLFNFYIKCEGTSDIKLEDSLVDFVNGTFVDEETFNFEVVYHSDSKNTFSVRFDIIEELPPIIYFKASVLGLATGRYIIPTGINVNVNLCEERGKKFFLDQIWGNTSDLLNAGCPPKPGSYEANDVPAYLPGLPLYALPGFHVQLTIELQSPPNISLIKVRVFFHITSSTGE